MVEIRYGERYEVANMAGQTVNEAREQFKAKFGIPDQARARLNDRNIRGSQELDTVLDDEDKLSFAAPKSRGAYLVGALLLALALTSGVFSYGFINASTTLHATVHSSNFADVTPNTAGIDSLTWTGYGFFKGAITPTDNGTASSSEDGTPIFNIDTTASHYTGDLVVTVSLGNADQLVKRYRMLALKLTMNTPDGAPVDINESGGPGDDDDWVMLTLDNGSVSMFPKGAISDNVCTVRVKSGFYITHVFPGTWEGSASPDLFCEVAQR